MRLALIGYGKMGKTIEEIALKNGDVIPFIIDKDNNAQINELSKQNVDVAIEFSNPESAFENIATCLTKQIPVVSGTTGWLDKIEMANDLCRQNNSAFMYASNFSIGVNIFFELNQFLAKKMKNYSQFRLNMEEIHHTEKLDAPSGTAITLANEIISVNPKYKSWINQEGENDEEISILSKRVENVPGTHLVNYTSDQDEIEIKHTAFSRMGFAQGAYEAAAWLKDKKGVFDIRDMLFS